jgi:hypothetical protein
MEDQIYQLCNDNTTNFSFFYNSLERVFVACLLAVYLYISYYYNNF